MSITLHLTPSALMSAFHVPAVEIDAGNSRDFVDVACKCYLLWQSEYPDYLPRLEIVGRPAESATLNRALFGQPQGCSNG